MKKLMATILCIAFGFCLTACGVDGETNTVSGEESAFEKAYSGLRGWVDCFEKAELKGIVTGGGIAGPNDASNHKDTMQKAYELGMGL